MELDCGIRHGRIDAWLSDELALPREGASWVFSSDGGVCYVATAPLESRSFGAIDLERTSVRIEGDDDAVEAFMHLFTLRFISAGG